MDKFVIVEQQDAVGLIRLNRPEVRNALNAAMIVALAEAVDRFEAHPSIGALVPDCRAVAPCDHVNKGMRQSCL